MAKLRVDHGPIDEDVLDDLTDEEKDWLRGWNRHSEIPGEDVPEGTDTTEVEAEEGYEDLSNEELRALLKARDLPVSGAKDDLIARLEEDDQEQG